MREDPELLAGRRQAVVAREWNEHLVTDSTHVDHSLRGQRRNQCAIKKRDHWHELRRLQQYRQLRSGAVDEIDSAGGIALPIRRQFGIKLTRKRSWQDHEAPATRVHENLHARRVELREPAVASAAEVPDKARLDVL